MLNKYYALRSILEVAFIPVEHRPHWISQKTVVLFLRKMVWVFADAAGMTKLGPNANGPKLWKHAEQKVWILRRRGLSWWIGELRFVRRLYYHGSICRPAVIA